MEVKKTISKFIENASKSMMIFFLSFIKSSCSRPENFAV